MKKNIYLICIFLLLVGCGSNNNSVKKSEVIIQGNELYKEEDIKNAFKTVKKDLTTFPNFVEIRKIKYDENKFSESDYYNNNHMIIYVDFYVGKHTDIESGFQPDSEYLNWQYILFKSSNGNWEIINQGY